MSPYYASDSAEYARYAQVRQTWHDQQAKTWYGGATTPGLEVGTYVEIADHPSLAQDSSEQRQFVVTEQFLDITNNLPADMTRQLPSGLLGFPRPTSVRHHHWQRSPRHPKGPRNTCALLACGAVWPWCRRASPRCAGPPHRGRRLPRWSARPAKWSIPTSWGASWSRCTGRWRRSTPRRRRRRRALQHARALCLPLGQ
uniref:contractile injection system protein, VgrG/Pvc8 family n=1 Tax=Xanthomonas oryzae TaxID=347 RepID=UPI003DA0DB73